MHQQFYDLADMTKGERFYGLYQFGDMSFVVKDPDLIKSITIKDFNHFHDRNSGATLDMFEGTFYDKVWANQLTLVRGEKWKDTR